MKGYEYSKNGIRYHRISKALANKLYSNGFPVIFCANNLRPEMFGVLVDIWNSDTTFEKACNSFSYYNCHDTETGKYIAFYAPATYFYHFTFSNGSNPYFGRFNPDNIKDFLKWKENYNVNLEYTSDNNGAYFNLIEKGVIA